MSSSKVKTPKRLLFTLHISHFDIQNIPSKYELKQPNHKTSDKSKVVVKITDEIKEIHQCNISIINLSGTTLYSCFWDKNPVYNNPLCIPIKYHAAYAIKHYQSNNSKGSICLKERITNQCTLPTSENLKIIINNQGTYECVGVVCSWECMCSFIDDNSHNPIFRQSKMLMYNMMNELTGYSGTVKPAPHWQLLKEYGGHLDIISFRNSKTITHIPRGTIDMHHNAIINEEIISLYDD